MVYERDRMCVAYIADWSLQLGNNFAPQWVIDCGYEYEIECEWPSAKIEDLLFVTQKMSEVFGCVSIFTFCIGKLDQK